MRTSTPSSRAARLIARPAQGARRRAVEGREEAVADHLDLAPVEALQLLRTSRLACEQIPPAAVAELGGMCGGIDDVGEHHPEQRAPSSPPLRRPSGTPRSPRRSPRCRRRTGTTPAAQLHDIAPPRSSPPIPRVADVPDPLVGTVHDERRHADPRQRLAHVQLGHGLRDRARLAGLAARRCVRASHVASRRILRCLEGARRRTSSVLSSAPHVPAFRSRPRRRAPPSSAPSRSRAPTTVRAIDAYMISAPTRSGCSAASVAPTRPPAA